MFQKLVSFTKKVADLPDQPTLDPSSLKAQFDAAPDEVRTYLNNLIDALKLTTSGDSGAKNIGATTISGLTGNDVQTILESINSRMYYVVEQGTNGNGTYRKYSDGTMECWNTFNYTSVDPAAVANTSFNGSTYYYVPGNWTYPASFLSGSSVSVLFSGDLGGLQPETHIVYPNDNTKCSIESGILGVSPSGKTLKQSLYARGVWK